MDPPKARREGNRANEAKNGGENGLPGVTFSRSSGAVNGWAPVETEGLSIRFLTAQVMKDSQHPCNEVSHHSLCQFYV